MRARKQIVTTQEIEIDVTGVTLLSSEEYDKSKDLIPLVDEYWWLRSPGFYPDRAADVIYDGSRGDLSVRDGEVCIRPALRIIGNLESLNLKSGDKIELVGYKWTILRGGLALCDELIGFMPFNKDPNDGNDYETSDVKEALEAWAKDKGIEVTTDAAEERV